MPTDAANRTAVERVLVEVTSLLLERARSELEREVQTAGDAASGDAAGRLLRVRELEYALQTIRQERGITHVVAAPQPRGRQVSKFYEVPGQEDA